MTSFILTEPVQALRYEHGNEQAVFALVCQGGRSASFPNYRGELHIYNDGPELRIQEGLWVVTIAGETLVVTHDRFVAAFQST